MTGRKPKAKQVSFPRCKTFCSLVSTALLSICTCIHLPWKSAGVTDAHSHSSMQLVGTGCNPSECQTLEESHTKKRYCISRQKIQCVSAALIYMLRWDCENTSEWQEMNGCIVPLSSSPSHLHHILSSLSQAAWPKQTAGVHAMAGQQGLQLMLLFWQQWRSANTDLCALPY